MNWYKTKYANAQVKVDLGDYEESLRAMLQDVSDRSQDSYTDLQHFQPNTNTILNSLQSAQYPNIALVQNAVTSKNQEALHNALMDIFTWQKQQKDYALWDKVRPAITEMQNFTEHLLGDKTIYTPQQMEKDLVNIVSETRQCMEHLRITVQDAISRIPTWNGSQVSVKTRGLDRDSYSEPQTSLSVEFLDSDAWAGEPDFTVFMELVKTPDNQPNAKKEYKIIDIDDVLEAGDKDFFTNSKTQQDYFNLIQEMRKPGSSSKSGKILKLYTARPTKDREFYLKQQKLPTGVFLTTDESFAEVFGLDYNENRDLWFVKVDSKYLLMTLDSPEQKQYQVVSEAPAEMHLMSG